MLFVRIHISSCLCSECEAKTEHWAGVPREVPTHDPEHGLYQPCENRRYEVRL